VNGIADRYPGLRIILAHAGGFLPYASHRFAELARAFRPDAANPGGILAHLFRHGAIIESAGVAKSQGFKGSRNEITGTAVRCATFTSRSRLGVSSRAGCPAGPRRLL